jgi:hypothetical protein
MQGRWNEANRKRIDEKFYQDMRDACRLEESEDTCLLVAGVYYNAVKALGDDVKRGQEQVGSQMKDLLQERMCMSGEAVGCAPKPKGDTWNDTIDALAVRTEWKAMDKRSQDQTKGRAT